MATQSQIPDDLLKKRFCVNNFGRPDPKQPDKNAKAEAYVNKCYDQNQILYPPNYNYGDKNRNIKKISSTIHYAHCVNTCVKK
jgi:hypothetical protein